MGHLCSPPATGYRSYIMSVGPGPPEERGEGSPYGSAKLPTLCNTDSFLSLPDASSPPDCHPQAGFNARHYLQAELLSNDVKTCTSNEMKEKEAHILWVQGPEDPR